MSQTEQANTAKTTTSKSKFERVFLCLTSLFGLVFAAMNTNSPQQLPLFILIVSSTTLFIWGMLFKPR